MYEPEVLKGFNLISQTKVKGRYDNYQWMPFTIIMATFENGAVLTIRDYRTINTSGTIDDIQVYIDLALYDGNVLHSIRKSKNNYHYCDKEFANYKLDDLIFQMFNYTV